MTNADVLADILQTQRNVAPLVYTPDPARRHACRPRCYEP